MCLQLLLEKIAIRSFYCNGNFITIESYFIIQTNIGKYTYTICRKYKNISIK